MSHLDYWDLFRVIALVLGGGVAALAVRVVVNYAQLYAASDKATYRGLLPLHVVLIGLSYLTLIAGSLVDLIAVIHQPLTWRAPVYVLSYLLGILALRDMLIYQKHRKMDLPHP